MQTHGKQSINFDKIKERAAFLNLSISEIEKLSNIAPRTLYAWHSGNPRLDKVIRVSETLNCSIDWLADKTSISSTLEQSHNNAFMLDLTNVPDDKKEEFQKRLLDYYKFLFFDMNL